MSFSFFKEENKQLELSNFFSCNLTDYFVHLNEGVHNILETTGYKLEVSIKYLGRR